MTRRRRRVRAQAAAPVIVVSDDDSEGDEYSNMEPVAAEPHPWTSRLVAAAAAAAAAIARAGRTSAENVAAAAVEPASSPATSASAVVDAAAATTAPSALQRAVSEAPAEEAGASCSICYEPIYEEGSHRAAALKCGHIFGSECIKRWLQQRNKCPQCNQRAKASEMTLLYNLPKLAPGSAPEDMQRQLQQLEASNRLEQQRAAELERSLKELQRQLALKEHQQLQQQHNQQAPPLPPGVDAGCGLPPWQQQQQQPQQHVPPSGPGRPANTSWCIQQQQLQLRPPLQPTPHAHWHSDSQAMPGSWRQQQQQMVGQKRLWEQAAGLAQERAAGLAQQQQQIPAVQDSVTRPLLTLLPVSAVTSISSAMIEAASVDARVGPAGTTASDGARGWRTGAGRSMLVGDPPLRRCLPGCFSTLQEFELSGSRSFYLDVPGTMAVAGETPGPGCSRLRKISLVCPGQLSYLQLPPSAGVIRCLASHKQLLTPNGSTDSSNINPNYLAVATDKAGLLIASLNSNNVVQTIPVNGPVWSVAWSPQNSQQLLLALDKGRMAVADIRKSSSQALLLSSNASSCCKPMQPLHSLLALQPSQLEKLSNSSEEGAGWGTAVAPEAVVACAGGVYSWCRSQPDTFNLLLPSSCHGGNCESLALAADGQTLAVSFRSPFGWSPAQAAVAGGGFIPSQPGSNGFTTRESPVHILCRLGVMKGLESLSLSAGCRGGVGSPEVDMLPSQAAMGASMTSGAQTTARNPAATRLAAEAGCSTDPAALDAAIKEWQRQLMQQTVKLFGHSSSKSLTHGCFIPGLPGLPDEQQLFVSADEHRCQPSLWGCSTGALLEQRQVWQSLPSHILQLGWGQSDSLAALLVGAMSERRLVLYNWQPDDTAGC